MRSKKASSPAFFLFIAVGVFLFGYLLYNWYPTFEVKQNTQGRTDREIVLALTEVPGNDAELDNVHKLYIILDGRSMDDENKKRYYNDHPGDKLWDRGRLVEEKRIIFFTNTRPKSKRDLAKYLD